MRLTPWTDAHEALLAHLASLPEVVRYIGDRSLWSAQRVAEVSAANTRHWQEHGFGWRVATLEETGEAIGFIALNFAGADSGIAADDYEIGWWLAPMAWGRGLAREGAGAVRDEAFTRLDAPSVVARIAPDNVASLGVAEAIGLTRARDGTGRFAETFSVLELTAADWRHRGG